MNMNGFDDLFAIAQQWLFETLMQPAMFALGFGHLLEDGYAAAGWLLVGLIQILVRSQICFAEQAIYFSCVKAFGDPLATVRCVPRPRTARNTRIRVRSQPLFG